MDYPPNSVPPSGSSPASNDADGKTKVGIIDANDKLRVGIIGCGASGLAAIKIIQESRPFQEGKWDLQVFEAREDVGGIWLPSPPISPDIPPLTPLYDSLTTNLPHPLMCFPSLLFPPSTPLYPPARAVETYLKDYADHFGLRKFINFGRKVVKTDWVVDPVNGRGVWQVQIQVQSVDTFESHTFDRLIIANGHYNLPAYPDTPGIQPWLDSLKLVHSAWYRSPHHVSDTVLVVGGGPSGMDISDEMAGTCKILIRSVPGGAEAQAAAAAASESGEDGRAIIKIRGRVVRFGDVNEGTVIFEDGSEETGIGYVILATGYQTSFPFLPTSLLTPAMPPPVPPLLPTLHNSTYHVFPLARDLFPLQATFDSTSIAFLGLPVKVIPFPLAEAQTRVVVKVFSDPSSLDTIAESTALVHRYDALYTQFDGDPIKIAKAFHKYAEKEQFEYRDLLHAFLGAEGDEFKCRPWEEEFYRNKDVLRKEWREIERQGEAEKWVGGVGMTGNVDEWVAVIKRLLEKANKKGSSVTGEEAKL